VFIHTFAATRRNQELKGGDMLLKNYCEYDKLLIDKGKAEQLVEDIRNMIKFTKLTDEKINQVTKMDINEIKKLRKEPNQ
jgi:DNA-binding transcriptional regulator YiaG